MSNKPYYFVTQRRKYTDRSPIPSRASLPEVLARQLTLYQGEDQSVAEDIAENIRAGHLILYRQDSEGITFTRTACENGRTHKEAVFSGGGLTLPHPINDLERIMKSAGHLDRMSFFAMFSPEEINYLRSFERVVKAAQPK